MSDQCGAQCPDLASEPRTAAVDPASWKKAASRKDQLTPEQRVQLEATWRAIQHGDPVMTFMADVPVRVSVSLEGAAVVDFLCGITPDGARLMGRLILTSAAAQTLRAKLLANKDIPDGLPAVTDLAGPA
ncbi:MAG: hypothetical protein ACLPKB_20785 [Xanthobacteraceae bacterium]